MDVPTSSTSTGHVFSDNLTPTTPHDELNTEENNQVSYREGRKRKHSDCSGQSRVNTVTSGSESVHVISSGDVDSVESVSENTRIQELTSNWAEGTLNTLNIKSKLNSLIPANKMISTYLPPSNLLTYIWGIPVELSNFVENLVQECIEMITIDSTPFKHIDIDDISDLRSSSVYRLMYDSPPSVAGLSNQANLRKLDVWRPRGENQRNNGDHVKYWIYQSFYVHSQIFIQHLITMCSIQEEEDPLTEELFTDLFQTFCSMFGLFSFKERNGKTLKIGQTLVKAIPDVIFPNFKESNENSISKNRNILAVCKVENEFEETPKHESVKRGKTIHVTRHLTDELLGQNGGDLLVYLSQLQRESLLGIVVQKTNVTFSHMKCTENQIQKIQQRHNTEPLDITYSRTYNILKKEDRKVLMRAFLTLSVIQTTPVSVFPPNSQ